jgi:thymidine kinase
MAKLYFYYAAMNAGKSTTLLQAAFNYAERGMATMLFTAAVDDRAGKGRISSRIGLDREATPFQAYTDLRACVADSPRPDCVLVDEAQFLTRAQVLQLAAIADEDGIPVLAYGLRTDFKGELFEGSAALLGLADNLVELKAICECGRKATMNLRVDAAGHAVSEGEQTEIGGNDRYVALCRKHFMRRQAARKQGARPGRRQRNRRLLPIKIADHVDDIAIANVDQQHVVIVAHPALVVAGARQAIAAIVVHIIARAIVTDTDADAGAERPVTIVRTPAMAAIQIAVCFAIAAPVITTPITASIAIIFAILLTGFTIIFAGVADIATVASAIGTIEVAAFITDIGAVAAQFTRFATVDPLRLCCCREQRCCHEAGHDQITHINLLHVSFEDNESITRVGLNTFEMKLSAI